MAYFPIIPANDQRQRRGLVPLKEQNVLLTPNPEGSGKRSKYAYVPTPGRRLLATLDGGNVRGVFAEPGCQDGALFAAGGSTFYRLSTSFTPISMGAIPGSDAVTMVSQRQKLGLRASGSMFQFDGSLTAVTDANAPAVTQDIASCATRITAVYSSLDLFGWSEAGDMLAWDPNGVAADFDLPDPIVSQSELNGKLWSLNSRSTQIWSPTGGIESEAFAPIDATINRGLAGREAKAKIGQGLAWLANTRSVVATTGLGIVKWDWPDLEDALRDLPAADIAAAKAWSYQEGSREYWALKTSLEECYVFDTQMRRGHVRTKFNESTFDLGFCTNYEGTVIVAGPDSPNIWALDPTVYSDAGDPIQRVVTFAVPVGANESIDRLVFDMRVYDQPISGEGSSPSMTIDYSADGGTTWASDEGFTREVALPGINEYFRIQDFQFGQATGDNPFLFRLQITNPIGFAISGVWVNPDPSELT
jgi:hypothetical protein